MLALTLVIAGVTPMPADAAHQHVYVFDNSFTPEVFTDAVPGDVDWEWAGGSHTVTAYAGASFDSGVRSGTATYTAKFNGGTVRYRCTLHSTLNASKECSGMCGYITDLPFLDVQKPRVAISHPRQNEIMVPIPSPSTSRIINNPVVIAGSAGDNVAVYGVGVRVYDTTGRVQEFPFTTCNGCRESESVTWNVTVSLLPGSYVSEAVAADTSGNTQVSTRVPFFVL